jgi:hypothetical protein
MLSSATSGVGPADGRYLIDSYIFSGDRQLLRCRPPDQRFLAAEKSMETLLDAEVTVKSIRTCQPFRSQEAAPGGFNRLPWDAIGQRRAMLKKYRQTLRLCQGEETVKKMCWAGGFDNISIDLI